jgi:hypothetical protein
MALAWRLPGRARENQRRQSLHPEQPWLWREDWEQGLVGSDGTGQSLLRLSTVPGVLGGRLEGTIEAAPGGAAGEVEVTLRCLCWRPQGRSSFSRIVWQECARAYAQPAPAGIAIPVGFDLPFDADGTGRSASDRMVQVLWHVIARSPMTGFRASFTVPVFRTPRSDPGQTREMLEARAGARLAASAPQAGNHFHFGAGRHKPLAAMFALFACVFLGGAAFLASRFEELAFGGTAVVVVAAGIGLVAASASLWLWFGETDVTAEGNVLHIRHSCLGVVRSRVVPAAEIRGFAIDPSMQKGADEVWYGLFIELANGRRAAAATGLAKDEAEAFAAALAHELGVEWGGRRF